MSTTCWRRSFTCVEGERGLHGWATSPSRALTRERFRFLEQARGLLRSSLLAFPRPGDALQVEPPKRRRGVRVFILGVRVGRLGLHCRGARRAWQHASAKGHSAQPRPPAAPICTSGADRRGPWEAFSSVAEQRQQEKMRGIAYRPFGNTQDPSPRVIRAVRTG